jgi:hypothetical protein
MRAAIHLEDLHPALQPISVKQPDGTQICSTHQAYLPGLAHLRREAARVDIFRDQDLHGACGTIAHVQRSEGGGVTTQCWDHPRGDSSDCTASQHPPHLAH